MSKLQEKGKNNPFPSEENLLPLMLQQLAQSMSCHSCQYSKTRTKTLILRD